MFNSYSSYDNLPEGISAYYHHSIIGLSPFYHHIITIHHHYSPDYHHSPPRITITQYKSPLIPINHHFPMVFLWFSYGFPINQRVSDWYSPSSRDLVASSVFALKTPRGARRYGRTRSGTPPETADREAGDLVSLHLSIHLSTYYIYIYIYVCDIYIYNI